MRGRETIGRRHKRLYFQHPDVLPILPPRPYVFVPPGRRSEIMTIMVGIGNRGCGLSIILAILMAAVGYLSIPGIHFATHTPYTRSYTLCNSSSLYMWMREPKSLSLSALPRVYTCNFRRLEWVLFEVSFQKQKCSSGKNIK